MWILLCRGRQAFTDVCKGLFMLHSNHICHLDMKSPNVLISNDGTCKISDLGLGRMIDVQASLVSTQDMSTLAYMSPEHIKGRFGLASDIWSLSTILWEVLPAYKTSPLSSGLSVIRIFHSSCQLGQVSRVCIPKSCWRSTEGILHTVAKGQPPTAGFDSLYRLGGYIGLNPKPLHVQICTLKMPTREASATDILVPSQAPQAIVDLMAACRQDNPKDRPRIGHICDVLEALDNDPLSSGNGSVYM